MKVHIGEKIKQKAKELRIGATELGKLMNTTKQNIYGIYKRKSCDNELLYSFSKVLNYNFFKYYEKNLNFVVEEEKEHYNIQSNKYRKDIENLTSEIVHLRKELTDLHEKYQLLKKINILLEKKKT